MGTLILYQGLVFGTFVGVGFGLVASPVALTSFLLAQPRIVRASGQLIFLCVLCSQVDSVVKMMIRNVVASFAVEHVQHVEQAADH